MIPHHYCKGRVDMRVAVDDTPLLVYMLGLVISTTADKKAVSYQIGKQHRRH
jgi:hypothetical protein